jgi:hypothetical protein
MNGEASESEGDVEFVDDAFLEEMDGDDGPAESDSDFKTMGESDLGDGEQMLYDEG